MRRSAKARATVVCLFGCFVPLCQPEGVCRTQVTAAQIIEAKARPACSDGSITQPPAQSQCSAADQPMYACAHARVDVDVRTHACMRDACTRVFVHADLHADLYGHGVLDNVSGTSTTQNGCPIIVTKKLKFCPWV